MNKQVSWRGLVIPLIVIIFWWGLGKAGLINLQLIPSIEQVCQALLELIKGQTLMRHLAISIQRVLIGFIFAGVIGVPFGIILGWFPGLQPWFNPTLHFLRQIPPVAWIPLFIMWFGIGEASKNAIIFYAAFFPIFLNTQLGVSQIAKEYWEVARLYQFPWSKTLVKLVLPGSARTIITGLRLGMGMSWRALVAAEMLAANSGLGYLIVISRSLVRLDELVVGIVIVGVVGIIMDGLSVWLEKQLPWAKNSKEGELDGAELIFSESNLKDL